MSTNKLLTDPVKQANDTAAEIEILQQALEDKQWIIEKTDAGLKALYGELQNANKELKKERYSLEFQIRNIIEKNADGIIVVDQAGIVRFINPAATVLLCRRREELMGGIFGFPVVAQESIELNLPLRSGDATTVEMRVMETEWEGENAFVVSMRDITERKRAEEALKQSEGYARNLIDSSLDMIIAVDNKRRITELNSAAEKVFGYQREEVLGKHVNLLYTDAKEGLSVHKKTVMNGHHVQEVLNRRKNGETFPSMLSSSVFQ